jgi:cell division septation protein DedD
MTTTETVKHGNLEVIIHSTFNDQDVVDLVSKLNKSGYRAWICKSKNKGDAE